MNESSWNPNSAPAGAPASETSSAGDAPGEAAAAAVDGAPGAPVAPPAASPPSYPPQVPPSQAPIAQPPPISASAGGIAGAGGFAGAVPLSALAPTGAAVAAATADPPAAPHLPRLGDALAAETTSPTKELFDRIVAEVRKIYVGQDELVLGTLVALFSGGHVLIESVPGLGKTLFVRTLGRVMGLKFGRIQFTADLMPSDVTGSPIFDAKTQDFRFRPGPVFTQLLLADEINRSPAKTHAALLETMQEYRVTVDNASHRLDRPFLVLATQNPIESEGTYNLPEAQLDRFMFKIRADYPTIEEEDEILRMHGEEVDFDTRLEDLAAVTSSAEILDTAEACRKVRLDPKLLNYINRIVRLTRDWPQFHLGASPRAGISLLQAARTLAACYGRDYAVPDDVVQLVLPALRHRVILSAEAEVEGRDVDDVLLELVRSVEVPRL